MDHTEPLVDPPAVHVAVGAAVRASLSGEGTWEGVVRVQLGPVALEPVLRMGVETGGTVGAYYGVPSYIDDAPLSIFELDAGLQARVRVLAHEALTADVVAGAVDRFDIWSVEYDDGYTYAYQTAVLEGSVGFGVTHPITGRLSVGADLLAAVFEHTLVGVTEEGDTETTAIMRWGFDPTVRLVVLLRL
jgi:hypothetical protein